MWHERKSENREENLWIYHFFPKKIFKSKRSTNFYWKPPVEFHFPGESYTWSTPTFHLFAFFHFFSTWMLIPEDGAYKLYFQSLEQIWMLSSPHSVSVGWRLSIFCSKIKIKKFTLSTVNLNCHINYPSGIIYYQCPLDIFY